MNRFLAATFAGLIALAVGIPALAQTAQKKPNILVI